MNLAINGGSHWSKHLRIGSEIAQRTLWPREKKPLYVKHTSQSNGGRRDGWSTGEICGAYIAQPSLASRPGSEPQTEASRPSPNTPSKASLPPREKVLPKCPVHCVTWHQVHQVIVKPRELSMEAVLSLYMSQFRFCVRDTYGYGRIYSDSIRLKPTAPFSQAVRISALAESQLLSFFEEVSQASSLHAQIGNLHTSSVKIALSQPQRTPKFGGNYHFLILIGIP